MRKFTFFYLLLIVFVSSFLGGAFVQYLNIHAVSHASQTEDILGELRTKAIHLIGEGDTVRASFFIDSNNAPSLVMYDEKGTNRFSLGLAEAGNPRMTFNHQNSKKLIAIGTSNDKVRNEKARFSIFDYKGMALWKAPNDKDYKMMR